jgi:hypothetical protein
MKTTVVFVGDNPSRKNAAQCIPLIGTPNYKRLKEWCLQLGLKPYLLNSNTLYWINLAKSLQNKGLPVISLSKKASNRLTAYNVPHFKAPNPSNVNRHMSNKEQLDLKLQELLSWVQKVTKLN